MDLLQTHVPNRFSCRHCRICPFILRVRFWSFRSKIIARLYHQNLHSFTQQGWKLSAVYFISLFIFIKTKSSQVMYASAYLFSVSCPKFTSHHQRPQIGKKYTKRRTHRLFFCRLIMTWTVPESHATDIPTLKPGGLWWFHDLVRTARAIPHEIFPSYSRQSVFATREYFSELVKKKL